MDSQAGQPFGGSAEPADPVGAQPIGGTPRYGRQYAGPPPVLAAMGTGRPHVRPGRIWYLAALAVFLGGVAWVVFGYVSLSGKVDAFARVPLPAGGTVALTHSGGYVVYYEGPGASSERIPRFSVQIAPAAPPAAVRGLRAYGSSVTYAIGAHQGRAVLTLQVVHPGRFLVQPSGAAAVSGGSDLAFGQSIGGSIVGIVLPTIGLILLGVAGGVAVFVARLVRTRLARERGC